MNKISKSTPVPDILLTRGEELKAKLIEQADNGETNFSFSSEVYADSTVKDRLKSDQHNKCSYCERYLNGDFGDVEHFRPKKAYQQSFGSAMNWPGYYWLAYNWDNLLLSCSECNRSFKKNLFPLEDEHKRDVPHRNVTQEVSLLINPTSEDPGRFVCFEEHIVKARVIDGAESSKGKATIDILKLNDRADLVEARRRKWNEYQTIKKSIAVIRSMLHNVNMSDYAEDMRDAILSQQRCLEEISSNMSEFTGMFKHQKD